MIQIEVPLEYLNNTIHALSLEMSDLRALYGDITKYKYSQEQVSECKSRLESIKNTIEYFNQVKREYKQQIKSLQKSLH